MTNDPIVAEIHRLREKEMERWGYDFEAFFKNLKEEEKEFSEALLPPPQLVARQAPRHRGSHR